MPKIAELKDFQVETVSVRSGSGTRQETRARMAVSGHRRDLRFTLWGKDARAFEKNLRSYDDTWSREGITEEERKAHFAERGFLVSLEGEFVRDVNPTTGVHYYNYIPSKVDLLEGPVAELHMARRLAVRTLQEADQAESPAAQLDILRKFVSGFSAFGGNAPAVRASVDAFRDKASSIRQDIEKARIPAAPEAPPKPEEPITNLDEERLEQRPGMRM